MLKPGWFIGFLMAYAILTLIANIAEMASPLAGVATHFEIFMTPPFGSLTAFFGWIGNLWEMLWFDYPSVFTGSFALVRYILFLPVSAGMVITFIAMIIRR